MGGYFADKFFAPRYFNNHYFGTTSGTLFVPTIKSRRRTTMSRRTLMDKPLWNIAHVYAR